jgi:hypothetical protein
MEYKSLRHTTCNENGKIEVEVHRYRTFFQWLFRRPAVLTYESDGGRVWFDKTTKQLLDDDSILVFILTVHNVLGNRNRAR